jgi:hypothetical protein
VNKTTSPPLRITKEARRKRVNCKKIARMHFLVVLVNTMYFLAAIRSRKYVDRDNNKTERIGKETAMSTFEQNNIGTYEVSLRYV